MNASAKDLYTQLQRHQSTIKTISLHRLFEEDKLRASKFSLSLHDLYLDYSKNHCSAETLKYLCDFAYASKLPRAIKALFDGETVNNTEERPALHTALRFQGSANTKEQELVEKARQQMAKFVDKIYTQQWLGHTGKPIKTVINIGIGGSDLGPRMVTQALSDYHQSVTVKFVANIDGVDLNDTLENTNPETTLFIITSKSFSTLETIENAMSARKWLLRNNCNQNQLQQHFIAISTNITAAEAFGVSKDNIFPLWDWVGGRYSLWSTIGLPIALAVGMENFNALLAGAHKIDEHFRTADLSQNLPVIAALITFWYSQFWNSNTHAILPYAQRLSRLPAYLQQLDMESLGKHVSRTGLQVDYPTGNIIWGTEGSNGQHSFHQLLHQGTQLIPVDFIMVRHPMSLLHNQHQHLQACCIGQSQALLQGKSLADAESDLRNQGLSEEAIKKLAPHKVVAGNKPSNTLIMDSLSPENLGSLIAFYEHKVYALSVLLDINPFDQWGVELGKQLGKPIYDALVNGNINSQWDGSTKSLIEKLKIE